MKNTRTRTRTAVAGLLLLALVQAPLAHAATAAATSEKSTATSASTTAAATSESTATGSTTVTSIATTASSTTDTASDSSTTTSAASTNTASSASSSSTSAYSLSNLPTLAGATIPTIVVPYTADAPYMQKSSLPEGTVFICVGAILAFLGFCVVAWRGMVAWTVERSVKKAALASVMAGEAKRAWMSGSLKPSGGFYQAAPDGSSMTLDHLASNGKPMPVSASVKQTSNKRSTRTIVPSNSSALFFSPTAAVGGGAANPANRSSSYLPAGYYAATGNPSTTTLSPSRAMARPHSSAHSPPPSPPLPPSRHSHNHGNIRPGSHNGSNLHLPGPLHNYPSTSSLDVRTGARDETLPGSRAPSAYFEDLLHEHGNGPRERF